MQAIIVFAALIAAASAGVLAPTLLAAPQPVLVGSPLVRTVSVAHPVIRTVQPVAVHQPILTRTVVAGPVLHSAPVVRTVGIAHAPLVAHPTIIG